MWGVGRQQVHEIFSCRLVHREAVELLSNYLTSYLWCLINLASGDSTGSNRIEKDWVPVFPGLVWGNWQEGARKGCEMG